jgi:hypothetical protein
MIVRLVPQLPFFTWAPKMLDDCWFFEYRRDLKKVADALVMYKIDIDGPAVLVFDGMP